MKHAYKHLTFWVLLAVAAGILIGWWDPTTAVKLKPLAEWFIKLLTLLVVPLIFLTVTLGIASMGDLKRVGQIGGKALIYFEVVTTFALLIGIAVAYLIRAGEGVLPIDTAQLSESQAAKIASFRARADDFSWSHFLLGNVPLQVLLVSLVAGVVITLLPRRPKQRSLNLLTTLSPYLFRILFIVMWLAPLAALGGMATTIGEYGLSALWPLAKLMLSVYVTMALFIFIVLWALMRYYRIRLWKFLVYIRAELLVVLGASSSEAGLPALMEKLERMGCSKPIVGLVVPAGYSFNLDGTTIYLSMATIFLAQVYSVDLSWWQLLTIIGVLMLTSKGAAGVSGMGFVVLISTLSAVKVIPIEGIVLLFGVDRFMSEARAITNFIGNGVATVVLANHERAFDRGMMELAFAEEALPETTERSEFKAISSEQ